MLHLRLVCSLLILAGFVGLVVSPPARTDAEEGKLPFKLPPGFVVERVAAAPLVEHPIMAGFDDEGRLFVAESAGKNMKGPDILKELPNSIRVLEDVDGDGRFDKAATFADKFSFPMGAHWHDGACYVGSAPSLWKLEDSSGKRGVAAQADRRTELVAGIRTTGNAADIHGPYAGPDGRFYWTDGGNGHDIRLPDGTNIKGSTARVFRCKPDGSAFEVVCAGGFDDPVEMTFTEEGEPFATVDIFINKPARIDALIYCIEGGAFPWRPQIRSEVKTTGELLPLIADIGWVAPSGLTRLRTDGLGKDFRDSLLVTEFNTHRVSRHALERVGAAFVTKAHEFLLSTDPDFHPTDVLEDADGSLLVVDTGGWFRNGCPTSQIAKPEIKGAIYRIRRADAPRIEDPRGRKLAWDKLTSAELAGLLDDARFAVRDRALVVLGKRGNDAVAALADVISKSASAQARRNAVWALTRIETAAAQAALRPALDDKELSVRLAAGHAAGLLRDGQALPALLQHLRTDHPAMQRQAATALGRIKNATAIPALFDVLGKGGDRFLEHALVYAIIQIADRPSTLERLKDASPALRRGAVIALDQMDGGNLTRELVTPLLDTDDRNLQQTALAIIAARPGWSGEIVGLLGKWLDEPKLDEGRQDSLRGALLAFGKEPAIQELVAKSLERPQTPVPVRLLLLDTVARMPAGKEKPLWLKSLGAALEHAEEKVVRQAVTSIRALSVGDFDAALEKVAGDGKRPAELRVAALAALGPRLKQLEAASFDFLVKCLKDESTPLLPLAAAEALSKPKLSDAQLLALTPALAAAGALELPNLLAGYEHSRDAAVGKQLIAALDKSPGLAGLSAGSLEQVLRNYPADVRAAALPVLKKLALDFEAQKAKLDTLHAGLQGGDPGRGKSIFAGKKTACVTCHAVNGEGAKIGPDLSKIGAIRTPRDLLEALVFPSASFVRGYEPFVVATRSGQVHSGIILRDTADDIFLLTPERNELRIRRADIETIARGKISVMPQGLDTQMSGAELADLIAYLHSLK